MAGQEFNVSFSAKTDNAQSIPFNTGICTGNTALGQASINAKLTTQWQQFTATVTASQSVNGGALRPQSTFREDIVQAYADLKPKYILLPGGNDQQDHYYWNKTIGPIITRPGRKGADLRAKNGRAQPWTIVTKLEIGNEDFIGNGPQSYQSRLNTITGAIKKDIVNRFELISSSQNITGWTSVDLHDYGHPSFFVDNYRRFDNMTRDGHFYYEDEFAAINSGLGGSSENGYTGPHRLGSVVYNQWAPNLIGFNPSGVLRTTSYSVQQGYSLYPTSYNLLSIQASAQPDSAQTMNVQLRDAKLTTDGSNKWQFNPSGNTNLQAANTFDTSNAVSVSQKVLTSSEIVSDTLRLSLPAYSFTTVSVRGT
ncbi:glycoside hydrolase family 51 protein [Tilletiaria anomala UBC 951]|uniref:Glycoside hydrolase family 51 protein n=1 Tax=Tilletiaria anomala (strain ATCC 24038 / CBS 436.72 / UBC 951) TaxID=1037660 RepID=A0A066W454_TILAU|nr:glycoside hydrolase family 51 protein [Tilletiaria anomala UBC 951]KDN47318.1 glycoside hydrolase family 51 protein [Tilletiaria anomala UBC 951]